MDTCSTVDGKMIEEYRMTKLREIENKILLDIKKHEQTISKCKKHQRIMDMTIQMCNFVNLLSTGGTIGSSGVGILTAILPCATLSGITSVINTTLQVTRKKVATKKKKHTEMIVLAQQTKNKLQKAISKTVDDDILDASEFEELVTLDDEYDDQKTKFCK